MFRIISLYLHHKHYAFNYMQVKKTKLKSIIPYEGLASGYSFRGKITHKPNGTVRVIQLKDFTNNYSEIGEECYLVDGSKIKDKYYLKDGDILNVDITVIVPDDENADLSVRPQGYHGDTSKMFLVGEVSPANKRLCMVAQEALYEGMRQVKPGVQLGQIGTAIEKYIKTNNKNNPRAKFSIVKDYCGHGIGSEFHEDPQVVHYKNSDRTVLKAGMCFTIEPMINAGKFGCRLDDEDSWTVYTADSKNSAQWEHTLVVTDTGCEVLTLRSDDTIPRIMKNA